MKIAEGTEFSHYRILKSLGRGGMGSVYLARDLQLDRRVAIKFLKAPAPAEAHAAAAFDEARIAALQTHPAIVTVHETGRFRGEAYLVMEYVEGTSLADLLETDKRILPERAVAIAKDLASALAALHQSGVRHGDIKPANVMLDRKGRVRVVDFGVACRVKEGDPAATALAGTIRYIAPEIHHGARAGFAADLFALGVVLYQMITGVLPFDGQYDAEAVFAITNQAPRPLGAIGVRLPAELVALIDGLLDKDPARRPTAAEAESALGSLHSIGSGPERWKWSPLRREVWLPAGLVAAALATAWLTWTTPPAVRPSAAAPPMVAVLPFDNLGAPGDDYFTDGVTDAVTFALAEGHACRVISRHSAMLYKATPKDPRQIAGELGANYLVTGSIRWTRGESDSLEITAAIVDPASAEYLWTHRYSGRRDDIFRFQSAIAADIESALGVGRQPGARPAEVAGPTSSLAAYDLYMKGLEFFNRSWERADIEAAAGLFDRAVATDSNFALAYAMLARCHASLYWDRHDVSESRRQRAFDAAGRALALAPDLPEAHLAMGYCYYHCERDFDRALAQFQAGLRLDPDHPELLCALAAVHRRQGNLERSLAEFQSALELDPRSHLKAFDVGLTLGMLRRYREAESYLERTTLLAPDYALAWIYRVWLPILDRGDTAAARRVLDVAAKTTDLSRSRYYWALCRILPPSEAAIAAPRSPYCDRVAFYLYHARRARARSDRSAEHAYSDSARVLLEAALRANPGDAYTQSDLGVARAGVGDLAGALADGEGAVRRLPSSSEAFDAPFFILNFAEILVISGAPDAAVDQLALLLQIPGFASRNYLKLDFVFRPLWDRPSFRRLVDSTAALP